MVALPSSSYNMVNIIVLFYISQIIFTVFYPSLKDLRETWKNENIYIYNFCCKGKGFLCHAFRAFLYLLQQIFKRVF